MLLGERIKGGEMENKNLVNLSVWIVGVIVSLVVGSGMINSLLTIPLVPNIITILAGWLVVIGVIFSVVLAIFSK